MSLDLTTELADIRAAVNDVLPDTCVISRLTETPDSQGGQVQTWAAVGTVACRLMANSGNTRGIAAQAQSVGEYTLTVPHNTDIQFDDRAVVDGETYRVAFVNDVADWRAAIRVDVNYEVN